MEPQQTSAGAPATQQMQPNGQSSTSLGQPVSAMPPVLAPSLAEDNDLIEPEWVGAMKQTMAHHRNDPHALAQAITALREDYLMKRYGRRVETSE